MCIGTPHMSGIKIKVSRAQAEFNKECIEAFEDHYKAYKLPRESCAK